MGCVYLVTNILNGMKYVGKTKNCLADRKKQHHSDLHDSYFHRAIKKYGKSNFKWEEVFFHSDEEELYRKENEFIERLNTRIPNGYNMTLGGDGLRGVIFSDEWRVKNRQRADILSKAVYCLETDKIYKSRAEAAKKCGIGAERVSACISGKVKHHKRFHFCNAEEMNEFKMTCDPSLDNTRQPFTKERSQHMSEAQKGKKMSKSYSEKLSIRMKQQLAALSTEELKQKMSKISKGTKLGKDNPSARRVYNYDTRQFFDTMKEAVRVLGLPPKAMSNISSCCSGKLNTAYGFHWKYAK